MLGELLVVTAPDERGQPFLISVGSESKVLLKLRTVAAVAGFLLSFLAYKFTARKKTR